MQYFLSVVIEDTNLSLSMKITRNINSIKSLNYQNISIFAASAVTLAYKLKYCVLD